MPELNYVAVTEVGKENGRLHHHIVMSGGVDINTLAEIWGKGYTTAKPLQFDEFGITGIAVYLVKSPILGKRWSASRNLEQPKTSERDGRIKEISRLRIGMEYVPYDEYPALLHKGERVLTASENKDYTNLQKAEKSADNAEGKYVIKIEFGEKSIYIDSLKAENPDDVNSFVELLLELIEEKIRRKGVVFA